MPFATLFGGSAHEPRESSISMPLELHFNTTAEPTAPKVDDASFPVQWGDTDSLATDIMSMSSTPQPLAENPQDTRPIRRGRRKESLQPIAPPPENSNSRWQDPQRSASDRKMYILEQQQARRAISKSPKRERGGKELVSSWHGPPPATPGTTSKSPRIRRKSLSIDVKHKMEIEKVASLWLGGGTTKPPDQADVEKTNLPTPETSVSSSSTLKDDPGEPPVPPSPPEKNATPINSPRKSRSRPGSSPKRSSDPTTIRRGKKASLLNSANNSAPKSPKSELERSNSDEGQQRRTRSRERRPRFRSKSDAIITSLPEQQRRQGTLPDLMKPQKVKSKANLMASEEAAAEEDAYHRQQQPRVRSRSKSVDRASRQSSRNLLAQEDATTIPAAAPPPAPSTFSSPRAPTRRGSKVGEATTPTAPPRVLKRRGSKSSELGIEKDSSTPTAAPRAQLKRRGSKSSGLNLTSNSHDETLGVEKDPSTPTAPSRAQLKRRGSKSSGLNLTNHDEVPSTTNPPPPPRVLRRRGSKSSELGVVSTHEDATTTTTPTAPPRVLKRRGSKSSDLGILKHNELDASHDNNNNNHTTKTSPDDSPPSSSPRRKIRSNKMLRGLSTSVLEDIHTPPTSSSLADRKSSPKHERRKSSGRSGGRQSRSQSVRNLEELCSENKQKKRSKSASRDARGNNTSQPQQPQRKESIKRQGPKNNNYQRKSMSNLMLHVDSGTAMSTKKVASSRNLFSSDDLLVRSNAQDEDDNDDVFKVPDSNQSNSNGVWKKWSDVGTTKKEDADTFLIPLKDDSNDNDKTSLWKKEFSASLVSLDTVVDGYEE